MREGDLLFLYCQLAVAAVAIIASVMYLRRVIFRLLADVARLQHEVDMLTPRPMAVPVFMPEPESKLDVEPEKLVRVELPQARLRTHHDIIVTNVRRGR